MAGFCPECGTARDDGTETCANCHHQFAGSATPSSREPEPRSYPAWLTPKWIGLGVGVLALAVAGGWVLTSGAGFAGMGPGAVKRVDASLLPVSFGGKCGYVDASGKMVINPQFDNAAAFNARLGLAPVLVGGKWGLIDREGKYVINPQFDQVEVKSDNATIGVALSGKIGTVDRDGKFIINPQFNSLSDFDSMGRAIAGVGEKVGVVDSSGKFLISPEFDRIVADKDWDPERTFDILAGPILVVRDGKFGFVDAAGKVVIQPQFSDASPFAANGLAAASIEQEDTDALKRLWNENANVAEANIRNALGSLLAGDIQRHDDKLSFVISNPGMTIGVDNWLSSNLAIIWAREAGSSGDFTLTQKVEVPKKSVFGYIDRSGKFVIAPQFASAGYFTGSGLALARVGTSWGFVDAKGKVVINPQYASVSSFVKSAGQWVAVVGVSGEGDDNYKYGLIDTKGAYKINPQFDSLQRFSPAGYAIARSGDLSGAVDQTGKYILQPVYSTLFEVPGTGNFFFVKPIAGTKDVQEIGIVDASGKVITTVRGGACSGAYSLSQ